jgi:hypothetical protein
VDVNLDPSLDTRPWAGLATSGVIMITAEAAQEGHGNWIYIHEMTHDRLMKYSTVGQLELVLSALGGDIFPEGRVKQNARALTDEIARHTWRVHEGTATYCANAVARAPAIPNSYAAAGAPFQFIDGRNPEPWMRLRIASLIARRACQTVVLDSWFEDSLWDLTHLQRHLSDPAHDPDLRLDLLLEEVAQMDDAEIAAGVGAEGVIGDPLGLIWLSDPTRVSVSPPRRPPELAAFVTEFAADVVRRGGLSPLERTRLEELGANPRLLPAVYATFPASFSLAVISGSGGAVASGDPRETMCASRLLVVIANSIMEQFPALHSTVDGQPRWLAEGRALVRAYRPDQPEVLLELSIDELAVHLAAVPEDTTVCMLNPCYDFEASDVLFWSTPVLAGRRHVVLVQQALSEVFPFLAQGIAGTTRLRGTAFEAGPGSDLGFLTLMPGGAPSPIVLIPTVIEAGEELMGTLTDTLARSSEGRVEIQFLTAPELGWCNQDLADIGRVIGWLTGRAIDG